MYVIQFLSPLQLEDVFGMTTFYNFCKSKVCLYRKRRTLMWVTSRNYKKLRRQTCFVVDGLHLNLKQLTRCLLDTLNTYCQKSYNQVFQRPINSNLKSFSLTISLITMCTNDIW